MCIPFDNSSAGSHHFNNGWSARFQKLSYIRVLSLLTVIWQHNVPKPSLWVWPSQGLFRRVTALRSVIIWLYRYDAVFTYQPLSLPRIQSTAEQRYTFIPCCALAMKQSRLLCSGQNRQVFVQRWGSLSHISLEYHLICFINVMDSDFLHYPCIR